ILRRAERYGRQYLGTTNPFLHELVPTVVQVMGGAFPELRNGAAKVTPTILDEEKAFLRTLDRGLKLFQEVVLRTREAGSEVISGKDAFDLHTTYGFFIDITEQMAAEIGMGVDRKEYQLLFKKFQEESGKERKKFVVSAVSGELPKTDDSPKYDPTSDF